MGTFSEQPLCDFHLRQAEAEFVRHEEQVLESQAATYNLLEQGAARYEELIPPSKLLDTEFGPVLWLLSAPFVADRAWEHISIEHRAVDWEALLQLTRPWSGTERLFVDLAYHLWSGSTTDVDGEALDITPHQWRARLDSWSFERVLQALAMAGGRRVVISAAEPPP